MDLNEARVVLDIYNKNPSLAINLTKELMAMNPKKMWHTVGILERHSRLINFKGLSDSVGAEASVSAEDNPLKYLFKERYGQVIDQQLKEARLKLYKLKEELDSLKKVKVNKGTFPKQIFIFWDSGFDKAPEIVKLCVLSYQDMNPDYNVVLLTEKNLHEYFPYWDIFKLSTVKIGMAHKADFLRTYLVYKYGGVWVDATTVCLKPLSNWLDSVVNEYDFFLFRQHKGLQDRLVKNWFLAGKKLHPFYGYMLNELIDYLFEERSSLLSISGLRHYKEDFFDDANSEFGGKELVYQMAVNRVAPYFFYHYLSYSILKNRFSTYLEYSEDPVFSACTDTNAKIRSDSYIVKSTYKTILRNKEIYKKLVMIIVEALSDNKRHI